MTRIEMRLWSPAVALLVGLLLCPVPTPAAAGSATSAGEVAAIKGAASASAGEQSRELQRQSPVFLGDMVRTGQGARLVLQLGRRTTLRLGEFTDIKLERYVVDAGGELNIGRGAIQFERTGPKADEPLTIRSEYGLIAVRGTRFFAGMSRGRFGVLVGSGRVAVTSGGATVIVGPQQGTDIERPGAPPSQPKGWNYERVREALQLVR
jgi:ferric-dicitrate binding protein FerR (iron transport regulator)